MGRAPSAYFVFCDRHRAETKAQLLADAESDKISVAQVAKALGELWRQLPDDEKKQYQELAAQKGQEIVEEEDGKENLNPSNQVAITPAQIVASCRGKLSAVVLQRCDPALRTRLLKTKEITDGESSKTEVQHPFGFPLSTVKRIMSMDQDLHSVSADALKMTAKSAELIVHVLIAQAYKIAVQNKRRTVKFSDVQAVLIKDKRWELTGIRDMLLHDEVFGDARLQEGSRRAPKPKEVDPKAQQITSFFKT